ncbi:MAG TPA: hypothetical protein VEU62_09050 [Bryobacterales bacterium]|nr:hypothetical protein [Bryobacterales bacterium]
MELFGKGKQPLAAVLLLVMLFCGFFWTGFFLGRRSARRTASSVPAGATSRPAVPAGERVAWQPFRI